MKLLPFNSSRYRLELENTAFAARIPEGARVLDAGAGASPYYPLFRHAHYESADHIANKNPDVPTTYVCDLRDIPVEDGRYDYVVLNQVLEHVPEPTETLRELHRVLKPGGRMLYSAPLFYEEHETPHDYYRYTQFGVRHLAESAGFRVERLDWLEGYFGTVAYQLDTMSRYLPVAPRSLAPGPAGVALVPFVLALKTMCLTGAALFHEMERRTKYTGAGYPKNYVAILSKPPETESPVSGETVGT